MPRKKGRSSPFMLLQERSSRGTGCGHWIVTMLSVSMSHIIPRVSVCKLRGSWSMRIPWRCDTGAQEEDTGRLWIGSDQKPSTLSDPLPLYSPSFFTIEDPGARWCAPLSTVHALFVPNPSRQGYLFLVVSYWYAISHDHLYPPRWYKDHCLKSLLMHSWILPLSCADLRPTILVYCFSPHLCACAPKVSGTWRAPARQ